MDVRSVAQLAYNAGWRGTDLLEAIAYAGIESNLDPNAKSPTGCCGLWQLCPCVTTDPQGNANAAYAKWKSAGNTFTRDWTPYDGGPNNPRWHDFYLQAGLVAGTVGPGTVPSAPSLPNPTDSLAQAIKNIQDSWQSLGLRIWLTLLGVIVVVVGIVILVWDDLKTGLTKAVKVADV